MSLSAKKALGIATGYTDEVVAGGGAIKGKNCVIASITDIAATSETPAGKRVTFQWTLDDGTTQTGTMDVFNGQDGTDGEGIDRMYINASGHLIVVYDDGTEEDCGEITIPSSQADWTETDTTSNAYILHKPTLGTAAGKDVAATGDAGATEVVMGNDSRLTDARNAADVSAWAKAATKPTYTASEVGALPDDTTIPTKVSDLTNDSGFITNVVNDLVNYYKKSETYTQAEVDALVSAVVTLDMRAVATLPTTDISTTTIYLVPSTSAQSGNVKDEYINLDGTSSGWEKIGTTDIDLTGYVTDAELTAALADYVTSAGLTTILASYATTSAMNTALGGKQDTISDLATIRSGAGAGATALQPSATSGLVKNDGTIDITQYASASAIPSAYTSNPAMNGTASAGSSTSYSRGDHVHPVDTSRAADSDVVHKNGVEAIDGQKSFRSSVKVGSSGEETVYAINGVTVDDAIGRFTISSDNIILNGDVSQVSFNIGNIHVDNNDNLVITANNNNNVLINAADAIELTADGSMEFTANDGDMCFLGDEGGSTIEFYTGSSVHINKQYNTSQSADTGGNLTVSGIITVNGSDYAERFETDDDIPMNRFVTLDGEKARLAQADDGYILGVTSDSPSVIGDKDIEGGIEVGLLGKLWVEHDGSAQVNGFVVSGNNGIATAADRGYRVMAVDGDRCRVLVK